MSATCCKIIMCGPRDWDDEIMVSQAFSIVGLQALFRKAEIITGGAKGADSIAHRKAGFLGHDTTVVPADWKQYGKAAGHIRNKAMLDLYPELVIAFARLPAGLSKGTGNMVDIAHKAGVAVVILSTYESG